jgi:uncharacterized protein YggU (UPF0235/DUF167 family)
MQQTDVVTDVVGGGDELESMLQIWVRPGASRTRVGGEHAGALAVAVTAKAVDGAATDAALTALARALGLPRRRVWLVRGATARQKTVGVALPSQELASRVTDLKG